MIEYEELEFKGYGATMMREDQPPPVGTELVATMESEMTDDFLAVTGEGKVTATIKVLAINRFLGVEWDLDAAIAFLEEAKRRLVHARRSSEG